MPGDLPKVACAFVVALGSRSTPDTALGCNGFISAGDSPGRP